MSPHLFVNNRLIFYLKIEFPPNILIKLLPATKVISNYFLTSPATYNADDRSASFDER